MTANGNTISSSDEMMDVDCSTASTPAYTRSYDFSEEQLNIASSRGTGAQHNALDIDDIASPEPHITYKDDHADLPCSHSAVQVSTEMLTNTTPDLERGWRRQGSEVCLSDTSHSDKGTDSDGAVKSLCEVHQQSQMRVIAKDAAMPVAMLELMHYFASKHGPKWIAGAGNQSQ